MNKLRTTLNGVIKSLQVTNDFRNPKTEDMDKLFPIYTSMMALTNSVATCSLIILSCVTLTVIGVIIVVVDVMEPTKDFWFNRGLLPIIFIPIVTNGMFGVMGLKGLATMRRFYSEMFCWTFDGLSPTQKLKIKQLCLKADRSLVFMLVLSFWCSAIIAEIQLWPTCLDVLKSIFTAPDWVQELVLLSLCLTILLVGSYFILVPFSMTYFLLLTTIQLMALVFEIEEFQRRIRFVSSNHDFDSLVQSALEHVVKKHQRISKLYLQFRQWVSLPFLVSSIGVVFILSFDTLLMFSISYDFTLNIWSYGHTLLVVFFICHSGQHFENLTAAIPKVLCDFIWYEWDKKNVDLLSLLLVNTSAPKQTSLTTSFLQLNYQFFSQCLTVSYVLINLVRALNK